MFADNIVLKNAAAVDKTFKLISLEGTSSERIDTSSTRVAPRVMRIKRTDATGKAGTDRYVVQFAKTAQGTGGKVVAVVNVSVQLPQDPALSSADIVDLIAFAKDFLTSDNVNALLLGDL